MTLVFALAELIRVKALSDLAIGYTDEAVESAFSEYNAYLWTNYKILGVDMAYGTEGSGPGMMENRIREFAENNANPEGGKSLVRETAEQASLDQYSLLTDGNGAGMIYEGVRAAKDGLLVNAIDGMMASSDSINNMESVDTDSMVAEAKESIASAQAEAAESEESDSTEVIEVDDDPLEDYESLKALMAQGILGTVVPDTSALSQAQIDLSGAPSNRSLNHGTGAAVSDNSFLDKALYMEYLLTEFSYYGEEKGHDGLVYEVEYTIANKETDEENLAAIVERLLAIREAANFATIMGSSNLTSQAELMAEALSTLAGPLAEAVYPVVYIAVVAAWAYIESTLDVRLILKGGKVSIVKSEEEWTSDIFHLASVLDVNKTAKECSSGLNYKEYLASFLALTSLDTLGLRSCDILENALNTQENYENVKIDNMLYKADVTIEYKGYEMFLSLLKPATVATDGYRFEKKKSMSY